FLEKEQIAAGVLLNQNMTVDGAMACIDEHADHDMALIHGGFTEAKALADRLGERVGAMRHVFSQPSKLYQRHFAGGERILLRDGFKRQRNRDYPPVEPFSDLNVTFREEGMQGFGDF